MLVLFFHFFDLLSQLRELARTGVLDQGFFRFFMLMGSVPRFVQMIGKVCGRFQVVISHAQIVRGTLI